MEKFVLYVTCFEYEVHPKCHEKYILYFQWGLCEESGDRGCFGALNSIPSSVDPKHLKESMCYRSTPLFLIHKRKFTSTCESLYELIKSETYAYWFFLLPRCWQRIWTTWMDSRSNILPIDFGVFEDAVFCECLQGLPKRGSSAMTMHRTTYHLLWGGFWHRRTSLLFLTHPTDLTSHWWLSFSFPNIKICLKGHYSRISS